MAHRPVKFKLTQYYINATNTLKNLTWIALLKVAIDWWLLNYGSDILFTLSILQAANKNVQYTSYVSNCNAWLGKIHYILLFMSLFVSVF